ncbi:MAG TPA: phosphatase PAP2 family protein [Vicinamibacteria bacterium]|nr:phosphatase PAP2 family protein [Vicinamibacteria bacterium]
MTGARGAPIERPTFYRRWLSPEGYLGIHLAVGFVLALLAGIAFGAIADEVAETHDVLRADARAHQVVTHIVSPRLTPLVVALTFMGSPQVVTVLSVLVITWLLIARSHRRLYAFAAAVLGSAVLTQALKAYFQRARPSSPLVLAHGYSFPSGHSMAAMTFYGTLAYVIYFSDKRHLKLRLAAVAACALMVGAIGLSRVYLGVHYFTDVVAGYAGGLCWASVCMSGTEAWVRWTDWRQRRRSVRAAS